MNTSGKPIDLLMIVTGLGIALYWLMFYTVGMAPATPPPGYFAFEHAFWPADLLLALGLIFAGARQLTGKSGGRPLALVCAGALMFLGVLDISFNLQNGVYGIGPAELLGNAFINLWCVGFGGVLAFRFARDTG